MASKVPTIRVWDGEEFVDWPEDEPLYCGGCGASMLGADDLFNRGIVRHGPGCDGTDPDGAVSALLDELADLAADGEDERRQVEADALAEAEAWA